MCLDQIPWEHSESHNQILKFKNLFKYWLTLCTLQWMTLYYWILWNKIFLQIMCFWMWLNELLIFSLVDFLVKINCNLRKILNFEFHGKFKLIFIIVRFLLRRKTHCRMEYTKKNREKRCRPSIRDRVQRNENFVEINPV